MKKIYSKKVALELRKRGFKIVGTEPNSNFPQFDVYLFESTPELENAFNGIMKGWK